MTPNPGFEPIAPTRPDSDDLAERKAQYAAWRDRLKKRNDDVVDLDEPAPEASRWSPESLFDPAPSD